MFSYFNNIDEEGLITYQDKAPKPNITVSRKDIDNDLGVHKASDSIDEVTFMVMKETENLRKTYVLERDPMMLKREVEPMTPNAVLPINKSNSND